MNVNFVLLSARTFERTLFNIELCNCFWSWKRENRLPCFCNIFYRLPFAFGRNNWQSAGMKQVNNAAHVETNNSNWARPSANEKRINFNRVMVFLLLLYFGLISSSAIYFSLNRVHHSFCGKQNLTKRKETLKLFHSSQQHLMKTKLVAISDQAEKSNRCQTPKKGEKEWRQKLEKMGV